MPGSTGRPPCRSMRGLLGSVRRRSRQRGTDGAHRRPRTGLLRAAHLAAHSCAAAHFILITDSGEILHEALPSKSDEAAMSASTHKVCTERRQTACHEDIHDSSAGRRTGFGRCRRPAGMTPGSSALSPGSAAFQQAHPSGPALMRLISLSCRNLITCCNMQSPQRKPSDHTFLDRNM